MTDYEELHDLAYLYGLEVYENIPLRNCSGLIDGDVIGLSDSLETSARKADILSEEISHHLLTVGNILDQTNNSNRKQEHRARMLSYEMRVPLIEIVYALQVGCSNIYEMAEYLGVSEQMLTEALNAYQSKYGLAVDVPDSDYTLTFEPLDYIFNGD